MNWQLLLSTFGLVFVAELGDKTQLAVVTQCCKYRRPLPIFVGASLALSGVTALGAVGGQLLSQVVPETALRYGAAAAFILMGLLIGREAARNKEEPEESCDCPDEVAPVMTVSPWHWPAFASTFGLLFFAELGDKTQLAVLSLAGKAGELLEILAGGALALTSVTALGVLCGESLCRWIPERTLLFVSAVAFVVMGVLMVVGVL